MLNAQPNDLQDPYIQSAQATDPVQKRFHDISIEELDRICAAHVKWLESDGKAGQRANFSRINLQGTNLARVNLQRANLAGANLQWINSFGAELQGADLSGADLRESYLEEANLQGAILEGANLQLAYLAGANLQGSDLTRANLQQANLRGRSAAFADEEAHDYFVTSSRYCRRMNSSHSVSISTASVSIFLV